MERIYLYAIAVVLGIVLILIANTVYKRKNLEKYAERTFGSPTDYDVSEANYQHLQAYHKYAKTEAIVDDITWHDLDMDAVYKVLNHNLSSVGDEVLYAHLRKQDDFECAFLSDLSETIAQKREYRTHIQRALGSLGRVPDNGLIDHIYAGAQNIPKQFLYFRLQALAALIPIILLPFSPSTAIMLFVLVLMVNMITFIGLNKTVTAHLRSLNYFVDVLKCARDLEKNTDLQIEGLNAFKTIRSYLSVFSTSALDGTGISALLMIVNAYFCLYGFSFMKIVNALETHFDEALSVYNQVGMVDCAYSRASLTQYRSFCKPEFTQDLAPKVVDLCHPLLNDPVPSTVNLDPNMLVTGSNASGKSTFVRSLAINVILGQRLNFCFAQSMQYRPCFVATSMAISDDVVSGDSYFVAEIKSIKRLLNVVKTYDYSLLVIDEILKGTNTIERIAASSAILLELADAPCFVCAATHDIELVRILESGYSNIHFSETIDAKGIHFDYTLKPGPSTTRNAIKLLEYYDYDVDIIQKANQLADDFTSRKQWPGHEGAKQLS